MTCKTVRWKENHENNENQVAHDMNNKSNLNVTYESRI